MVTRMPLSPASVTWSPLGEFVNLVPDWICSSTLPAGPFWNSIVRRSYPGCVPVRTASMKATAGAGEVPTALPPAHTNAGRFDSGVGDPPGGVGEAVGLDAGAPTGCILSRGKFPTTTMPTAIAASHAAAIPAIQNGPFCAGASESDDLTRSRRAPLGDPAMSSNT